MQPPQSRPRNQACNASLEASAGTKAHGARTARTRRVIEGPNYGMRSDDARTRAASQVRDAPEELTSTPDQISADVMQPGHAPRAVSFSSNGVPICREQ